MTGPTNPSASAGMGDCVAQAGDVSVLKGGTFYVTPGGPLRAGLQYLVSEDPYTWKVMFMTDTASESHDLKRGDTVTVDGTQVHVRDACASKIVLYTSPAST